MPLMMSTIILLWILITSIFMAVSSASLFSLWICLEVNMMMFIPLMNSKNILSSNSMLLYFIIQSLASSIFIMAFFAYSLNPTINFLTSTLISMAILMKLGAAPFHIWFPQVAEGLSFPPLLILILLQKIIPLYILSFTNNYILIMSIIFSAIMGSLGGWNQNSLRKIITFSSISHMAWMISIIMSSNHWWTMYLLIYSIIILPLIFMLYFSNISYISQINSSKEFYYKMMLIIILFSLGGLPPFLGFSMKWMSIKIISFSTPILLTFLIPSSLLNLFFYTRILYPLFLKMYTKNTLNLKMKKYSYLISFHCMGLLLLIPLI